MISSFLLLFKHFYLLIRHMYQVLNRRTSNFTMVIANS